MGNRYDFTDSGVDPVSLIFPTGCAPAMINFNLSGDALLHCLRISGAGILLVDQDSECRARIAEEEERIHNELQMRMVRLSEVLKAQIAAMKVARIDDESRKDIGGDSPVALLYTRYAPESITLTLSLPCHTLLDLRYPLRLTLNCGSKTVN